MQSSSNASTRLALAGGVLAGIGASACCVGPVLLLSLGLGGDWIGHLTALEPYRPIFIWLTALFLGAAFRKLYLSPQCCGGGQLHCGPHEACAEDHVLDLRAAFLSLKDQPCINFLLLYSSACRHPRFPEAHRPRSSTYRT
ncbi:MAG TPA: mercuric transporter MerT family protein [Acidobacteriaceae bacterium]|nr:mercuric transporter MerT family protein [Acidobacteriaceae bacterium]